MQATRNRDTRPELELRVALHRRGFRFRVASRPLKDRRFTADLVFRKLRVAIFVDGCFWHSCPLHRKPPKQNVAYWTSKLAHNRARDAATDRALLDAGWQVIRIWEHDPVEDAVGRVASLLADVSRLNGVASHHGRVR